ncbi:MAG: protein-disulfide reductase DsbD [Pseudomonadota bacterium]
MSSVQPGGAGGQSWRWSLLLMWFLAVFAQAAEFDFGSDGWEQEEPFLKVDEAFVLSAALNENGVFQAHWDMPDGYYLYRHQFKFRSKAEHVSFGEANIPPGKQKTDEFFGDVEVYYHSADVAVPLTRTGEGAAEIGVGYQGCADRGLCYPPEWRWFEVNGNNLVAVSAGATVVPSIGGGQLAGVADPVAAPAVAASPAVSAAGVGTLQVADTEEQILAGILADESLIYALALFFIAGIGLAFTPCVLPMVPILSSIIVGEGDDISKRRAFTLSLAYVLGMASTYAFVGMLVGLFGAELNLQAALQSPGVLIFFALVFVVLSLSMFGFYELQLPQALQDRLNNMGQRQQGGKHASVLVMGSLSSLVVSPCVSAPLAGALIYISTTSDAVLGGSALLALGLGMGVPLMIVGGSGGHWLPRAGAWMNGVKAVFGVMLLAVAIWLLERVVPASVTLALWAALLLGSGVYLGVLDFAPRQGIAQLGKAAGTLGFLWGVLLLIGAASGASDPLKPLARIGGPVAGVGAGVAHAEPQWQPVKSLADVQQQIAASGQPAILDLYADWCISCKVMERNVFPDSAVASRLNQFTLLRADVTDNDEIDRELLNHYGLFGPPSLVFFTEDGSELSEVRIQGEVNAPTLAAHLGSVLAALNTSETSNVGEIAAISR